LAVLPSTPRSGAKEDGEPVFEEADPISIENVDPDQIRKSAVYKGSFYNEGSFHS
jgi:hypothetical protein